MYFPAGVYVSLVNCTCVQNHVHSLLYSLVKSNSKIQQWLTLEINIAFSGKTYTFPPKNMLTPPKLVGRNYPLFFSWMLTPVCCWFIYPTFRDGREDELQDDGESVTWPGWCMVRLGR